MGWLKVLLVIGLILAGLIIDLGGNPTGDRIGTSARRRYHSVRNMILTLLAPFPGFRYWKEPGAFATYLVPGNLGRFLAWFQILMSAAVSLTQSSHTRRSRLADRRPSQYSFSGIEAISFACAEVVDPRRNMQSCVRKIFWRLLVFYVLSIRASCDWTPPAPPPRDHPDVVLATLLIPVIVGMVVPSDDPELLQYTGDAASSPFVIAFHRVGIKVLPSIVNGGILLASLSAATACLYGSSRTLYGLALRGQAPKIFAKCIKSTGMPITALAFSAAFSPIAYLTLSNGSSTVLTWFANLTRCVLSISSRQDSL
jgi:amino acid transporter